MTIRSVRLKEHLGATEVEVSPSPTIVGVADESIPPGPYAKRTDSHGFIMTGNDAPDSAPPLLVLGDSFVESIYAAEDRRFVSQVEKALLDSSTPYRVLNGGYSGMTSLHMMGILTAKAPSHLTPEGKLMLVIGQSDANALLSPGLYWDPSRTVSPFQPPTAAHGAPEGDWRQSLHRMVTALAQVSKTLGFDTAISAGMYRNGDFNDDAVLRRTHRRDREAYERVFAVRRAIPDVVEQVASEQSLPYFDGRSILVEHPEYFYDVLHLNHSGQDVYSEHLARWVATEWKNS